MGVEATFVIRCDRCKELLYDSDGDLIRATTYPQAQIVAENDGWEYLITDTGRVLVCKTCINRAKIMHRWIKANAVIGTVS
jgi:hypothetical protein